MSFNLLHHMKTNVNTKISSEFNIDNRRNYNRQFFNSEFANNKGIRKI